MREYKLLQVCISGMILAYAASRSILFIFALVVFACFEARPTAILARPSELVELLVVSDCRDVMQKLRLIVGLMRVAALQASDTVALLKCGKETSNARKKRTIEGERIVMVNLLMEQFCCEI